MNDKEIDQANRRMFAQLNEETYNSIVALLHTNPWEFIPEPDTKPPF